MTTIQKFDARHSFYSINEAAVAMLAEVCDLLNSSDLTYVVAGGWVPCLRTRNDLIPDHPGTRDVDILFNDKKDQIEIAVKTLMVEGYQPSAKHEFQLLKEFSVEGKILLFNVDLMHPAESAEKGADLFEDILDLGIKEDYDPQNTRKMKSICFPSSEIIFEQKLWSTFRNDKILQSGEKLVLNIPLMDEGALILSKCKSVQSDKRPRDAFDIYYVLSGNNGSAVAGRLKFMSKEFPQVQTQLGLLNSFISKESLKFDVNALKYCKDIRPDPLPSEFVLRTLFE